MPSETRIKRLQKLALQVASRAVSYELADPRLTFVTLTRVELSGDLSFATIYWSVLGEGGERSKVAHALANGTSYVQSAIARAFSTRRSPRITFEFDPSIEGAIRVSKILDDLKREREEREGDDAPDDDGDAADAPEPA